MQLDATQAQLCCWQISRALSVCAWIQDSRREGACCAGGLYNIIRGVPMVSQQGNKVTWFMQGQGQLGAEGFVAGSMYIIFALSCFGLINAPNWLGSLHKSNYHVACYVLLAVAVIVFQRIVGFYTQKTGYHLRYYLIDWLQGVRS